MAYRYIEHPYRGAIEGHFDCLLECFVIVSLQSLSRIWLTDITEVVINFSVIVNRLRGQVESFDLVIC